MRLCSYYSPQQAALPVHLTSLSIIIKAESKLHYIIGLGQCQVGLGCINGREPWVGFGAGAGHLRCSNLIKTVIYSQTVSVSVCVCARGF